MPSITYAQHVMWEKKLEDPKTTPKDKVVAKEFLDADKAMGKYQDKSPGYIGAIIKEDDKLCILFHNKVQLWSIPTGGVGYREKDEDAVKREMMEELGIEVEESHYTGFIKIQRPTKELFFRIYTVDKYSGTIANKEPHKHARIRLISRFELNNLIKMGTVGDTIIQPLNNHWI